MNYYALVDADGGSSVALFFIFDRSYRNIVSIRWYAVRQKHLAKHANRIVRTNCQMIRIRFE